MLLSILFWITAATWLTVVVASAAGVAILPSLPALAARADRASVSVIIPVRDESASVEITADRTWMLTTALQRRPSRTTAPRTCQVPR